MLSMSRIDRAIVCPASAVLPEADSITAGASRGTALHAFLAAALEVGRDEALSRIQDEDDRVAAELLNLEGLPASKPGGWAAEVAYLYNAETGAAREVGRAIGRAYPPHDLPEIAGTADVVGLADDGETIVVMDYKSGHAWVPAARDSWQLRSLALAACHAHGRHRAMVGIVRLWGDGGHWTTTAMLEEMDLDCAAVELHHLVGRVFNAAVEYKERQRMPQVVEGPHCAFCSSLPWCPAKSALVLAAAASPEKMVLPVEVALTIETAARAYERAKTAIDLLEKHVLAPIREFAQSTPVPLPGGLVLSEVEQSREVVHGQIAVDVLAKLHGPDVARAACEIKSSKAAIERALKPLVTTDRKLSALKKETLTALREAGGIEERFAHYVREHRPKAEP